MLLIIIQAKGKKKKKLKSKVIRQKQLDFLFFFIFYFQEFYTIISLHNGGESEVVASGFLLVDRLETKFD